MRITPLALIIGILALGAPVFAGIVHEPIRTMIVNQPLTLKVELQDLTEVSSVELLTRTQEGEAFSATELPKLTDSLYQMTWTPMAEPDGVLQYFIRVTLASKQVVTLPDIQPDLYPISIRVEPQEGVPFVRILEPANATVLRDPYPTVLISMDDELNKLDLKTLKLQLNDTDITKKALISPTFISWVPDMPLDDGPYTLSISINDKSGVAHTRTRSFKIFRKDPEFILLNGSTEYEAYNYNKASGTPARKPFESAFTLKTAIKAGFMNADFYTRLDSKENAEEQPYNRTLLSVYDEWKNIQINVGDTTPVMSDITLNGINVRGFDATWDVFNILGLRKLLMIEAVQGLSQMHVQSGQQARQRNLSAYQVKLGLGGVENAITYMRVKDDTASYSYFNETPTSSKCLIPPKENIVLGLSSLVKFSELSQFKLDAGATIFYSDANAGELPAEMRSQLPIPESAQDQLFKFIPPRVSILGGIGAGGQVNYKTPIIFRELMFKSDAKWFSPDYNSIGATGVKKDNFEYSGGLTLRLLSNMLTLQGDYLHQQNNVARSKQATDFSEGLKGNVMFTLPAVGALSVGISQTSKEKKLNNGEVLPLNTTENRTANDLKILSVAITGIQYQMGRINTKINWNYSTNEFNDKVGTDNSFIAKSSGYSVQFNMEPYQLKLDYTKSDKDANSISTPNTTTFTTLGARVYYDLLPRVATVYAGVKRTIGLNTVTGFALDNSKETYSLGAIYNLPEIYVFKTSRFTASLDIVNSADNIQKTDENKNFKETTLMLKYSAEF